MFVIILNYKVPLDQVDLVRPTHREYLLKEGMDKGLIIASGAQVPRTGGMIIFNSSSRSEAETFIANDPFFIKGIADFELIEFDPVFLDSRLT